MLCITAKDAQERNHLAATTHASDHDLVQPTPKVNLTMSISDYRPRTLDGSFSSIGSMSSISDYQPISDNVPAPQAHITQMEHTSLPDTSTAKSQLRI